MILLLLLIVSVALILLTGRREKNKRMAALSAAVFLFAYAFLTIHPLPSPSISYMYDEPAGFVEFRGESKYSKAGDYFNSLSPFLLTSERDSAEIREDGKTFGYPGLKDLGIDTAFCRSETLFVRIFAFNAEGERYKLSLFEGDSAIYKEGERDSTYAFFPVRDADSVILTVSDDNPHNHSFFFKREKSILILSKSYSRRLQAFSMNLSMLFDSVKFYSGISDGRRTLSIKKNYSGVILAEGGLNGYAEVPSLSLGSLSLDGKSYEKIAEFAERVRSGPLRIRRPFNPENEVKSGAAERLLFHVLNGLPRILSFAGFIVSLILLF